MLRPKCRCAWYCRLLLPWFRLRLPITQPSSLIDSSMPSDIDSRLLHDASKHPQACSRSNSVADIDAEAPVGTCVSEIFPTVPLSLNARSPTFLRTISPNSETALQALTRKRGTTLSQYPSAWQTPRSPYLTLPEGPQSPYTESGQPTFNPDDTSTANDNWRS